jgi:3-deoxy-D-manno-octulosonate 8-phosphate phosphatase (KDO 8-P phosphatase)
MTDDRALLNRAAGIELLVLDVDGVLTDGRVATLPDGTELKWFHVRDGAGIAAWHALGRRTAILSGRTSSVVSRRAAELGIAWVRQGVADKRAELEAILRGVGTTAERTAAMGDDLADLAVLSAVGVSAAVADACPEILAAADYVCRTPGGRGAVREFIEWLLRAQNAWDAVLKRNA